MTKKKDLGLHTLFFQFPPFNPHIFEGIISLLWDLNLKLKFYLLALFY